MYTLSIGGSCLMYPQIKKLTDEEKTLFLTIQLLLVEEKWNYVKVWNMFEGKTDRMTLLIMIQSPELFNDQI